MRSRLGSILCVFSLLVALAGCGGGNDDGGTITPPPASNTPPPPPPPPPPTPAAGHRRGRRTVTEARRFGHRARRRDRRRHYDPHRDGFHRARRRSRQAQRRRQHLRGHAAWRRIRRAGVEVRIPVPNVTLTPIQKSRSPRRSRAEPWMILDDTVLARWHAEPKVHSFSFFISVVVTYQMPIAQAVPCDHHDTRSPAVQPCTGCWLDVRPLTPSPATMADHQWTATGPVYRIGTTIRSSISWPPVPCHRHSPCERTGGSVTRSRQPHIRLHYHSASGQYAVQRLHYSDFGYQLQIRQWAVRARLPESWRSCVYPNR